MKYKKIRQRIVNHPPRFLAMGFFAVILIGSLLLMLPFAQGEGQNTTYLDALFTATSAVCVTGLTTVATVSHWTLFGQIVIILLIQIGGLGFMTITTVMAMVLGKRITLNDRLIIKEQMNTVSLSGMVKLIRYVLASTFIIEGIGALLLSFQFIPEFGLARGLYVSIFQSISSFCNAGFDVLGTASIVKYNNNPLILLTIGSLIILGGLGFNVYMDVTANKLNFRKYALHTKIVLSMTGILLLAGTIGFLTLEALNANTMADMSFSTKTLNAFFQSVTTRTAGYFSMDQAQLTDPSIMLSIILMFIGGSPAGTAGGIKTVTFAMLLLMTYSEIKGNRDLEIFQRRISIDQGKRAISIMVLGLSWVLTATFVLLALEPFALQDLLFEVTSAFATVGLTRNLTPQLTEISKSVLILSMYIGRVGTMTLVFAFANNKDKKYHKEAYGNVIIG
ncbi:MAG: Trk family potassium uptake protein [Gallicola sp.]|uniref:TrkH family potassium uptake protein n=1 Tax=Gallicola sp. Sow4_E12 TaxID=3438785 RepID=UPI0018496015|nr:Trk family potassium uptake protein [Gallicola sp.]